MSNWSLVFRKNDPRRTWYDPPPELPSPTLPQKILCFLHIRHHWHLMRCRDRGDFSRWDYICTACHYQKTDLLTNRDRNE